MKNFVFALTSSAMVLASMAGVAPAMAQTAPGMADLIGMRGSSIENEMTKRGFKLAKNVGAAAMWWNGSTRKCVSVAVDNGRVASMQSASASDCGKSGNDDGAIAGVVAGAAVIGLIAALSGHHKNSDNRNNNATYNQEYQRGYQDAMYGSHYDNNDTESYHSGYMAGEAERNNRRYANSAVARGLPAAAGNACISKGEYEWGVSPGSVSVVSSHRFGEGSYDVKLATGHWRATCVVTENGQISRFTPN